MEIWYFDTSAVNEFMKGLTVEDALATKQLQLNKGRDWRLSPVTLWEILMTSDEKRRDEIVHFCQHLFNRDLLPSPPELIIHYIEQGMPKYEAPRELVSKTALADTWRELVNDRNRCFVFDHLELNRRLKLIQSFSKDMHKIIGNDDFIIDPNASFAGGEFSLSNLINELPIVKSKGRLSRKERLALKVSIYYILLILCAEADLDNIATKEFWEKRGIDSTLERIVHVIKELPLLVYRGPFYVMSCMTIEQAKGEYSRGVWFDCLHSIYITYVDMIFTSDRHFQELRDVIPEPELKRKIHHMSELTISQHAVDIFGANVT